MKAVGEMRSFGDRWHSHQQRKFIPSDAPYKIFAAHKSRNAFGKIPYHLIARSVSTHAINGPEIVQVEDDEEQNLASVRRIPDYFARAAVEDLLIECSRHRIMMGVKQFSVVGASEAIDGGGKE